MTSQAHSPDPRMKHCTNPIRNARKNCCHITDLFFRSELIQLAGSDAGERWFREQSQAADLSRLHGLAHQTHVPAGSNPTSPQPTPEASSHRITEIDCRKSRCILPTQDIPNPLYLSMDEDLPYHLGSLYPCQNCENDIGLLFTDAAHTVLTRLSRPPSR